MSDEQFPPQQQPYPGRSGDMQPEPHDEMRDYVGRGLLEGKRRIRVNCVAPGPVWTPLIPSTFDAEKTAEFGKQVPMQRAAQPDEIAPSYVFFASETLSSYYTGEVLAPTGGETLPG